ncbi:MAG: hypothetical protein ABUK01_01665 [Leptospirales bacterium]
MDAETIGNAIVSIGVAFILFAGKEWFVAAMSNTMSLAKEWRYKKLSEVIVRIDVWALAVFSLWGVAWGGLVNRERKSFLTLFILSQLWFLLMIGFGLLYYSLKNPEVGSYIDLFVRRLISGAWTLHLVNYIFIPPFDASFFYMHKKLLQKTLIAVKIIFILSLMAGFWNNDFINGNQFLNWFIME